MDERGRATLDTLMSGERTKVLQQKRFNTIQVIRGSNAPTPGKE
jgi:pilus assembly protein CpaB